jgi:hypothetical protein
MSEEIKDFLNNNTYKDLIPFFLEYIQNHVYVSTKIASKDFLDRKFKISNDLDLHKLYDSRIIRMIGKITSECIKLNMMYKISRHTYRIIDVRNKKITELINKLKIV